MNETLEQIVTRVEQEMSEWPPHTVSNLEFARRLVAALGAQEPVAWEMKGYTDVFTSDPDVANTPALWRKLYAAPVVPPREVIDDFERQVAALTDRVEIAKRDKETWFNQLAAAQAENARLAKERDEAISAVQRLQEGQSFDVVVAADITRRGMEQLAAAQATNARLLEALETCTDGDYSTGHVIHPSFDVTLVNAALAIPSDDTALQERLAEERERCAKVCDHEHNRDDLTGDYRYGAGICAAAIRSMK